MMLRSLIVTMSVILFTFSGCKKSSETPPEAAPQPAEKTTAAAPAKPAESEAGKETAEAAKPAEAAAEKVAFTGDAEAGCAMCVYHLKDATGCTLAVKIDDKTYRVEGVEMDSYGDAHAEDGLCNTARKVKLVGSIEGDTFVAEQMELQP